MIVTQQRGITPDELSDVMSDAGKHCSPALIRYHCRDSRGWLHGRAKLVGRSWQIDPDAADDFAARWTPYQSLRKK